MLLLKLYQVSMNACLDSDKIKYNGTRGLGNLLRYTQPVTLGMLFFLFIVILSSKITAGFLIRIIVEVHLFKSFYYPCRKKEHIRHN